MAMAVACCPAFLVLRTEVVFLTTYSLTCLDLSPPVKRSLTPAWIPARGLPSYHALVSPKLHRISDPSAAKKIRPVNPDFFEEHRASYALLRVKQYLQIRIKLFLMSRVMTPWHASLSEV